MSLTKAQVVEISEKCLTLVKAKVGEVDAARSRLEGAAEGISFFLSSLVSEIEAGTTESEEGAVVTQLSKS